MTISNKTIIILCILFSNIFIFSNSLYSKRINQEKHYQSIICDKLNGKIEYRLEDKTRIDCLTKKYAIEFDFANKWGECIGQALYYSLAVKKQPSCALIMENKEKDNKYLNRLKEVANSYDIKVIIIYSEDDNILYKFIN